MQRRANRLDARRQRFEKAVIGTLPPGVPQGAAAEWIEGPVEGEPPAEVPLAQASVPLL